MIFHVLAIPVYPTRKEISICAFTQKVYKFSKAMTQRGHTVFHYGHPDSEVECTKHFSVISRKTYDDVYQKKDWRDFHSQKTKNKAHEEFNSNAKVLIKKNKQYYRSPLKCVRNQRQQASFLLKSHYCKTHPHGRDVDYLPRLILHQD